MIDCINVKLTLIDDIMAMMNNIENAKVITTTDQFELRDSNMIVVSIDNIEMPNPNLPDYIFTVRIIVDSYIADDNEGVEFNSICSQIMSRLSNILYGLTKDFSCFSTDVVGVISPSVATSRDENSNIFNVTFKIVTSHDLEE